MTAPRPTLNRLIYRVVMMDASEDEVYHLIPTTDRFVHLSLGKICLCQPQIRLINLLDEEEEFPGLVEELGCFLPGEIPEKIIAVVHKPDLVRTPTPAGLKI